MNKLGQHFLKNETALKKIADALVLKPSDFVIEIGAGHGELTDELRIKNSELRIVAIEKDAKFTKLLEKKFAEDKNIKIIEGDALKELPSIIHNSLFKIQNYKIVGNIPYYITGHLFRVIGELEHKPELCVFTIQKEVAERIAAMPPKMNRLAASIQFWAEPKIIMHLPKNDFEPPPEVDSATLKLKVKSGKLKVGDLKYYKAVKALFAQPRKTILNNISHSVYHVSREEIAEKLRKIGINPEDRSQNLSVEDIVKIAATFGF